MDLFSFFVLFFSSSKEPVVASVAVGFVAVLLEGSLVELLEAKRADKVFGVKLAEHGGDAAAGDGLAAARARRPTHLVVVQFAVRRPFVLVKVAVSKRLLALSAGAATH